MISAKKTILAVVLGAVFCMAATAAHARDVTSQGKTSVSVRGGFSKNYVEIGGSFGYFVADRFMPGVRYSYAHQTGEVSDGTSFSQDLHDAGLFCRYYLLDEGSVFPFLIVDGGYLKLSQEGKSVLNDSWDMFSVFAGGGGVAFLSSNFAIEAVIGWREYQSIPDEVTQFESGIEWTLGVGLYF